MPRPAARGKPINTPLPNGRKSTQRERLINGMITAANREGYTGANVSAVIELAGVSRPTFYDYFADRDECFTATITDTHERLASQVDAALAAQRPELALQAAVGALVAFAAEEPARAHFVMSESMSGGPPALDARDRGVVELERAIERAQRQGSATKTMPDLPDRLVIGGIYRLLSSRLRRGETNLAPLADALSDWISRYGSPPGKHRWDSAKLAPAPPHSAFVVRKPASAPKPLGPGRPGISSEEVAANHRERILYAAAALAAEKGYGATTIADITRGAGIDGRAFYGLFVDKQDAFMTLHEIGLQQVLNVTANAFFSGATWPERIWEAASAFTQFLEVNPLITHLGFVEAQAVGPGAAQRTQDSQLAFAIFLQEGYMHASKDPPGRAAVEAIVASVFELVYQQARARSAPKLSRIHGHMTFLCLAPFLGARAANAFIDKKRRARASARAGQPRPRGKA